MSDKKPICGILAGEPEIIGERCADGGKCHHRCTDTCSRRATCAPLSGSGLRFDWSAPALRAHADLAGDRFEAPVAGWSGPAQDERQPLAWLIDWPEEPELGHYFSDEPNEHARSRPLYAAPTAQTAPQPVSSALADVVAERRRQIAVEGWTPEHDDEHSNGEMALAAACYARHAIVPPALSDVPATWPWGASWWKPGDPRRMLVKAAALILAEIDRLDRAAARGGVQ